MYKLLMRQRFFALRFIIPGAIFTVAGLAMLASDEWRSIGWRFAAGGPLAVGLGIYFWPNENPSDTNEG